MQCTGARHWRSAGSHVLKRHWGSAVHRCHALKKRRKTCLEEALGKCSAQVPGTGEVQEDMS